MNLKSANAGNAEAFNDMTFRRAFSLAMDRVSMVDIAGFGYPVVNAHASGLPPRFDSWRNKAAEGAQDEWLAYDIDRANKLLDDAGYKKDGEGFRTTPSGKPITFPIIVPNGWTDWIDAVQIATEGLRKIGINASVATPEYEQWQKQILDGSFEAVMNSRADGPTPSAAISNRCRPPSADGSPARLRATPIRNSTRCLTHIAGRRRTRTARSCSTRCS